MVLRVSSSSVRLLGHSCCNITQVFSAGEILAQSLSQLERDIHPVVIISAYNKALKEALEIIKKISIPIDTNDDAQMLSLIKTSIGTKFVMRWSDLMCKLALQAVRTVAVEEGPTKTVDIKRYARVEKVPGGEIEDSKVLSGIMLNKDITHPKMRRRIEKPRIILLDCPLEYKKGESQTNIEISKEADWSRIQEIEEEQVKAMVDKILEFKPDLVITEKGISGACIVTLWRAAFSYRFTRLRTTLPLQGERLRTPTSTEVRQQPYRTRCRRHDREPCGGSARVRRWYQVRAVPHREDGRRVLHVPHGVHDAEGVHDSAARAVEGHPERDRSQPC